MRQRVRPCDEGERSDERACGYEGKRDDCHHSHKPHKDAPRGETNRVSSVNSRRLCSAIWPEWAPIFHHHPAPWRECRHNEWRTPHPPCITMRGVSGSTCKNKCARDGRVPPTSSKPQLSWLPPEHEDQSNQRLDPIEAESGVMGPYSLSVVAIRETLGSLEAILARGGGKGEDDVRGCQCKRVVGKYQARGSLDG